MKYPFTAAVIGSGFMGETHLGVLVNAVERVLLCSNDAEKGKALANRYGCVFYDSHVKMLEQEKIDFASVCVPTPLHAAISLDCLRHGVNVLCEKPFASTLEEAKEMIRAAEDAGKLLMIAHCVRFSKNYEYLRRCIADRRFGKLMYLRLFRHSAAPAWSAGNWLSDPGISGGVVRDFHIHDTDLIHHALGMPSSVFTTGDHLSCSTVYEYGKDLTVTAGASWRKIKSFAFESGFDAGFEAAVIKSCNGKTQLITDSGCTDPIPDEPYPLYLQGVSNYQNEIDYFCRCLMENTHPTHCSPLHTLNSLRISFAESESIRTGKTVTLD